MLRESRYAPIVGSDYFYVRILGSKFKFEFNCWEDALQYLEEAVGCIYTYAL